LEGRQLENTTTLWGQSTTTTVASLLLSATIFLSTPLLSHARLEGVNNPQLLPDGPQSENLVIDVAGYLTPREVKRLQTRVENIQRDTGVKLRILAQAYPQTPGLAIKEYWGVDDDTVVFVADPGLGNILNFSVGANVDLEVPPNFWTKLANKYGTKFYWADKGEEASIVAATDAIEFCLNEPSGRAKCSTVLDVDEGLAKEDVKRDAKATAGGFNLKLPF
tara:strand:+ start:2954 stop:3616 length:663 start_codon:yes stop_codon:yes gene_type:complete